jgi:hypothetical protein
MERTGTERKGWEGTGSERKGEERFFFKLVGTNLK